MSEPLQGPFGYMQKYTWKHTNTCRLQTLQSTNMCTPRTLSPSPWCSAYIQACYMPGHAIMHLLVILPYYAITLVAHNMSCTHEKVIPQNLENTSLQINVMKHNMNRAWPLFYISDISILKLGNEMRSLTQKWCNLRGVPFRRNYFRYWPIFLSWRWTCFRTPVSVTVSSAFCLSPQLLICACCRCRH